MGLQAKGLNPSRFSPKGAFYLAQHLVIFPKLLLYSEMVIYHPTSWKQCPTHVVILPQFYFILGGSFCHHKVNKSDGCLVTEECANAGPDCDPYMGSMLTKSPYT